MEIVPRPVVGEDIRRKTSCSNTIQARDALVITFVITIRGKRKCNWLGLAGDRQFSISTRLSNSHPKCDFIAVLNVDCRFGIHMFHRFWDSSNPSRKPLSRLARYYFDSTFRI